MVSIQRYRFDNDVTLVEKKRNVSFLFLHKVAFWSGTLQKPKSSVRTITAEQFDVNLQASAVGLYCFWFACDHANPLLLMSPYLVCFLSYHLFYWLKFEFVRHSLWIWLNVPAQRRETPQVYIFRPPVTDLKNNNTTNIHDLVMTS